MSPTDAFLCGFVVAGALGCCAVRASYRNGVTDGFGFSWEPWNPGYRKAGLYLRKYMRYRWGQLDNPQYVQGLEKSE